ncbi:MAG: alkaline phosphatase D family protein [Planctomycetes bacterium]|nr:alkaline phosphatase D family protein [Planctomycetota bacterium]
MNRRNFMAQASAAGMTVPFVLAAEQLQKDVPKKEGGASPEYIWCGAVTPYAARIVVKIVEPPTPKPKDKDDKPVAPTPKVRIAVSEKPSLAAAIHTEEHLATPSNDYTLAFDLAGLKPLTTYYYAAEIEGTLSKTLHGKFKTFPAGAANFNVCFASCARTGSRHVVFETILKHEPAAFIHMGDFHYENIGRLDSAKRRGAYLKVHESPVQAALYRSTPIAYMWDDHDYLGNNTGGESPAGTEARITYQSCVPHYPLPLGTGNVPIAQAFSIGRVRFILTDLRSARKKKTMMGEAQKKWFKSELLSARKTHGLIVWVSTMPWIGKVDPKKQTDYWNNWAEERAEIANFLKQNAIKNICILSGDSHMLAIDDGAHSDYADGGGAPIPVFQAAALDNKGSVKGGPYSKGTFPGPGQFGMMSITDDGKGIQVQWSGRNAEDKEIVGHSFRV